MSAIEQLIGLVAGKIKSVGLLTDLITLEARLAGLSIMPFLVLLLVLGVITIALWFVSMVLIGYGIFVATNSLLIAIGSVFLLHIAICAILIKYLLKNLHRMKFSKTRAYLSGDKSFNYVRGLEHHEQTKQTRARYQRARKKITSSSSKN